MDSVLKAFLADDGSIRQLPAKHAKRLVVLDHVAQSLPVGERFAEAELNERLHAFHPDHAALRRYLVEAGLLIREAGVYWRSGGTVPN